MPMKTKKSCISKRLKANSRSCCDRCLTVRVCVCVCVCLEKRVWGDMNGTNNFGNLAVDGCIILIGPKERCLGMWLKIGYFKMASSFRHS